MFSAIRLIVSVTSQAFIMLNFGGKISIYGRD
jgi:hypothetical protein